MADHIQKANPCGARKQRERAAGLDLPSLRSCVHGKPTVCRPWQAHCAPKNPSGTASQTPELGQSSSPHISTTCGGLMPAVSRDDK